MSSGPPASSSGDQSSWEVRVAFYDVLKRAGGFDALHAEAGRDVLVFHFGHAAAFGCLGWSSWRRVPTSELSAALGASRSGVTLAVSAATSCTAARIRYSVLYWQPGGKSVVFMGHVARTEWAALMKRSSPREPSSADQGV